MCSEAYPVLALSFKLSQLEKLADPLFVAALPLSVSSTVHMYCTECRQPRAKYALSGGCPETGKCPKTGFAQVFLLAPVDGAGCLQLVKDKLIKVSHGDLQLV